MPNSGRRADQAASLFLVRNDLDGVGEFDSGDWFQQLICAFQATPSVRGCIDQHERQLARRLWRQ